MLLNWAAIVVFFMIAYFILRITKGRKGSAKFRWIGDDEFEFDIVGESRRQDSLEAIAGPKTEDGYRLHCKATLFPERNNPHDKNAVAVLIKRKHVGYLARADAQAYRKVLTSIGKDHEPISVDAMIVGGWSRDEGYDEGSFGVKLDLDPSLSPDRMKTERL